MSKNITGYILTGLFAMGVGALGSWVYFNAANEEKLDFAEDMVIYNECREIISEKGDPEFDNEEALNGWLEAGGDRYTYYYKYKNANPVLTQTEYVNSSGTAKASGFQVACDESGNILLTEVSDELAASKSGLQTGDIITEIDGISVIETGYAEIVTKLMGKQDTSVNLTISRNKETLDVEFKRDNEYLRGVYSEKKRDVTYIKIDEISIYLDGYLKNEFEKIETNKIIIDLRDNPGGDSKSAIGAASFFINEGYVDYDNFGRSTQRLEIEDNGVIFDGDIVILINEKTASAAEVFTALMMQYGDKVTVVGTTSFGKGIYQQSEELSDGGILNYTAGYYYVGEWENFHGIGITPDIEIEMDRELIGSEEDIQLEKALELLK